MGWFFYKRLQVLPGVSVNLSGRGISLSIGGKGVYYRQPLVEWQDLVPDHKTNDNVEGATPPVAPPAPPRTFKPHRRARGNTLGFLVYCAVFLVVVALISAAIAKPYKGVRIKPQWNGAVVLQGKRTRTYIMPQDRPGTRLHCSRSGHHQICSWW